ncbi:MAG: hypothetical protein ACRCSF_02215 [Mycobacteriaceae bacterium]
MSQLPAEDELKAQADSTESWGARHKLLIVALVIIVIFHGSLLFSGSYQRTYDAYVHIFFADHYARDWFSSWDHRWYTGFSVLSYPPGSHQSVALLSHLIGLRAGFVIVQISALLLLTIGVYRWSKLWVDQESAGWAAILLAVSSSIAETVHVFGQLPTTLSLGFLLNALPFVDRWARTGNRKSLILGVALTMATTACHHVTTLFGAVFFVGPVLLAAVMSGLRTPLEQEGKGHPVRVNVGLLWPLIARRLRRVLPALLRSIFFGLLMIIALIGVVLPYWLYSRSDPITNVSIPHASRDSFLINHNAGLVFWLIPWGLMLLVLPYALIRGFASSAWPLTASLLGLAVLGTGGTTPIPRILLGGAFDVLTLDRFTFWATICVLPLAGRFVTSVLKGTLRVAIEARLGKFFAVGLPAALLILQLIVTVISANLTHYRPFQPPSIAIEPIVSFLNKDDHSNWRYLTLGFGDQMAWLSANTTAETVDGNYHSARALPELTSRPVERLENSKYAGVPGIGSLQQFLAVPERYSLKYIFSIDDFYAPLLDASGWKDLGTLENGVEVWERADVTPLPAVGVTREAQLWQRLMWGVIPPSAIVFALLLLLCELCGFFPEHKGRHYVLPRSIAIGHDIGRRIISPIAWIYASCDAGLARAAERIPVDSETPVFDRWMPMLPVLERLRKFAHESRIQKPGRLGALVVIGLTAFVGSYFWVKESALRSPGQVVADYYDHLDFRRFDQAWELLDPDTRPSYIQYQRNLGSDGGLIASFAKLDSVEADVKSSTKNRVSVSVTRKYLTSLQAYEITDQLILQDTDQGWKIDLPPVDPSQPVNQFDSRTSVNFLAQGRRTIEADATARADILDRPQLVLSEVKGLRVEGRWVVIGQVTNVDVQPADVTVTAQLRNQNLGLVASWNASQVMVHTLLPGQRSPFRLEFQSLAGLGSYGTEVDGGVQAAGDNSFEVAAPATPVQNKKLNGPVEFDPQVITPLFLDQDASINSLDVYAKAVVTTKVNPLRLQILQARVEGKDIVGLIRNDATVEATVPHLLIGYNDVQGRLAWVDHAYLERSIAPARTVPFRIPLANPTGLSDIAVPTTAYSGPAQNIWNDKSSLLSVPNGSQFSTADLVVTSYVRGGQ